MRGESGAPIYGKKRMEGLISPRQVLQIPVCCLQTAAKGCWQDTKQMIKLRARFRR